MTRSNRPDPKPLTEKQQRVLEVFAAMQVTVGAPTLQQLAEHLGYSTSSVEAHVTALIKKGVMVRPVGTQRSLQLVSPPPPLTEAELAKSDNLRDPRAAFVIGAEGEVIVLRGARP